MKPQAIKVLFVCRAGKDRSRTAAELTLEELPGIEVRHGGVDQDAVNPISRHDLVWADRIVCMENHQRGKIRRRMKGLSQKISVWNIQDEYLYGDPQLQAEVISRIPTLLR